MCEELRELSARQWTTSLTNDWRMTSQPGPDDLEQLQLSDFKLGLNVESTRTDLLWQLACGRDCQAPVMSVPPRAFFFCRLRRPTLPVPETILFNTLYPLTMHCMFPEPDDLDEMAGPNLETQLRRYLYQSVVHFPPQHPNLFPLLRLIEGTSDALDFDGQRPNLPTQGILAAITPVYKHTLVDEIQLRRQKCIEDRVANPTASQPEQHLFSEETLLFYLLQLVHGCMALTEANFCLRHISPHHVMIQQDDALVWGDLLRIAPLGCHLTSQPCPEGGPHGLVSLAEAMLDGYSPAIGVLRGFWGQEACLLLEKSLCPVPTPDLLGVLREGLVRWLWRDLATDPFSADQLPLEPINLKGLQQLFAAAPMAPPPIGIAHGSHVAFSFLPVLHSDSDADQEEVGPALGHSVSGGRVPNTTPLRSQQSFRKGSVTDPGVESSATALFGKRAGSEAHLSHSDH
eukprot:GGOE01058482.1.p1 GENE.GGOE01058482.1~~GGOE01058482.1.p1  ORF type:complete len:458 (-),score=134.19 GGOE01058482.1:406-1779(-)